MKTDSELQTDIENAIDRDWDINDWDIHVIVSCKKVLLSGTVKSFYQKDEVERICRSTPGISKVDNELKVK
jgi:osmotically-inducible protein OsmY